MNIMCNRFIRFIKKDQRGLGTIEMVVILAVLVVLALSFKKFSSELFKEKMKEVEDADKHLITYSEVITNTFV